MINEEQKVTVMDSVEAQFADAQTIDQTGTILTNSFARAFDSRSEANLVLDVMDSLGMSNNYEINQNGNKYIITVKNIDEQQLDILQRKINIASWSTRTQQIANAVTNFATDIADYALNGAVAPTVGAISNAALTTGRVVGTATLKAGAMVSASVIRNGRAACTEIYNSREVKDVWKEAKGAISDIGAFIFGSSKGNGNNKWEVC